MSSLRPQRGAIIYESSRSCALHLILYTSSVYLQREKWTIFRVRLQNFALNLTGVFSMFIGVTGQNGIIKGAID